MPEMFIVLKDTLIFTEKQILYLDIHYQNFIHFMNCLYIANSFLSIKTVLVKNIYCFHLIDEFVKYKNCPIFQQDFVSQDQ